MNLFNEVIKMKFGIIAFLVLSLLSCSEKKEVKEVVREQTDTIESATIRKDSIPETLKPQMIARGSEPGWYAEFYWDFVSISLEYDQVKLNLKHDFSKIGEDEFHAEIMNGTSVDEKVQIQIKRGSCTEEASGEKRERRIEIKYKGMVYKGCATVEL